MVMQKMISMQRRLVLIDVYSLQINSKFLIVVLRSRTFLKRTTVDGIDLGV